MLTDVIQEKLTDVKMLTNMKRLTDVVQEVGNCKEVDRSELKVDRCEKK